MKLKSIEGLIFLTYLTKYNISTIYKVVEGFEDIEDLLPLLDKYNVQPITTDQAKRGEEIALIAIERLKYHCIEAIPFYSAKYPSTLKNVPHNPPIIYIRGICKFENKLAAVVGSREISSSGRQKTKEITRNLIEEGYGIVSGLAYGVDSISHREAIDNNGYTIAVLPNSLDSIYPAPNWALANAILENGGLLMSELIFDVNRGKKSFVERNRIQAGLSSVIIPTEMRIESGTMHTINYALGQKKAVILPDFGFDPETDNGIHFLAKKHRDSQIGRIEIARTMEDFAEKLKKINQDRQLKMF